MKIIKISTDLELTEHEFPTGTISEQNEFLRNLIGEGCDIYEHVLPNRLYTKLKMKTRPTNIPGQCVSMLIDEEGLMKDGRIVVNPVGSYLYETDKHGYPIVGDILFVGEEWSGDGIEFCGIEESVFNQLKEELNHIISGFKKGE